MRRKLNNKGVTLIELIVSFVLVAIAIVYFYQTLYTVKKLYNESQSDTKNFVDVNYAYRIIDELNKRCVGDEECLESEMGEYEEKDENFLAEYVSLDWEDDFKMLEFTINEQSYFMYFYDNESNILEGESEAESEE